MIQDRFKCRYWSKEKNRYLTTNKLVYNDGTYTQVGSRQSSNGCYYSYIVDEYNTFDIIQEQCTGLKDKNGKLIYEGDIVRDDIGLIAPVCFDEVNAMFYIDRYIGVYNYPFAYFYHYDSETELEVIGNIHENADLLENKDE